MVPSCMRVMISMSTRSRTCLPEHGNLPKSYLVLSIIFACSNVCVPIYNLYFKPIKHDWKRDFVKRLPCYGGEIFITFLEDLTLDQLEPIESISGLCVCTNSYISYYCSYTL